MFENIVLRRVFKPKREDVTEGHSMHGGLVRKPERKMPFGRPRHR
jgi:hypothetical protein